MQARVQPYMGVDWAGTGIDDNGMTAMQVQCCDY
jgi:hypothetical protein